VPRRYVAEGNFVLALVEARTEPSTANHDLFRVQNGNIAEHWDVLSPIPPRNHWKNANGHQYREFGTRAWRDPNQSWRLACGGLPHVIRLTTITLRHFDAGERAPATTPKADQRAAAKKPLIDRLVHAGE
jgi:hypothetical protein